MIDHVALLSALPRSLEEIEAGSTDLSKDYIRTQVLRNLNTPESAWKTLRPQLKDKADALFDWCLNAGARVVESAGLRELTDALANYEIVVVLAHWKGPSFHSKDLPDTFEGISHVAQTLEVENALPPGTSARAARRVLQKTLNAQVVSWKDRLDLSGLGGEDLVLGDYYGRCLLREKMDETVTVGCNHSVVPGARLELSDGLWTARDIASCFPDRWNGICDFVCCRSLYLSDVVKSKTRAGLIRADARYLHPERVLDIVGRTMQAVADGQSYTKAAYNMEKDVT